VKVCEKLKATTKIFYIYKLQTNNSQILGFIGSTHATESKVSDENFHFTNFFIQQLKQSFRIH